MHLGVQVWLPRCLFLYGNANGYTQTHIVYRLIGLRLYIAIGHETEAES